MCQSSGFIWLRQQETTYLERLIVFLLLFVDDAKTEINLVCLIKVRLHFHDLRERVFGMVQRAIAVVEDANAVPQPGFLSFIPKHH